MAQNRKQLLWLFLLIPILSITWVLFVRNSNETSTKTRENPPTTHAMELVPRSDSPKRVIGPDYVPVSTIKKPRPSQTSDQSSECLMTGKVTSDTGLPLPGAKVSVYTSGPDYSALEPAWPDPVATADCDSDGHYIIHIPNPLGYAAIEVSKTGYGMLLERRYILLPEKIEKNYVLQSGGGCVEGMVLSGGKPVAGSRVDIKFHPADLYNPARPVMISGTTDDEGKFSIHGLIECRVSVEATPPLGQNLQRKGIDFVTSPGPCTNLNLDLTSGRTISFVVKNRKGDPINHARVRIPRKIILQAESNEHGVIELVVTLDTVVYDGEITASDYQTLTINIDVNIPQREVILRQKEVLQGVVLSDSGDPVPGARVVMFVGNDPTGNPFFHDWIDTDVAGRFAKHLSCAFVSQVSVSKEGYRPTQLSFKPPKELRDVQIRLESVKTGIFGRVVDSEGNPVPRYVAVLQLATPGTKPFRKSIEDGDGRFLVSEVDAGSYIMYIKSDPSSQSFAISRREEVTLKSGYYFGEVDFVLTPISNAKK